MHSRFVFGLLSLLTIAAVSLLLSCDKDRLANSQPPKLALSAHELLFSANAGGSNPPSQNIQVTNAGSGELTYEISKKKSWLSVQTLGSAPGEIVVICFVGTLATGVYYDTIVVSAITDNTLNSPQEIAVTFTVKGAMGVSPSILQFTYTAGSTTPPAETVAITSPGGGSLDFTVNDTVSWLKVTPLNGTSPDTVLVELDTVGGIDQGVYFSHLPILSDQAANSPFNIACSLFVDAWAENSAGSDFDFRGVNAIDANNIWVVGFIPNNNWIGVVFQSTDGGQTWNQRADAWRPGTSFGGVDFYGNWGTIVGDSGFILQSINGGDSWTETLVADSISLWQVALVTADSGWVVGTKGSVLRTIDGGDNWLRQTTLITTALADVKFVDSRNGWAVGNGGVILHTADGGESWQQQTSGVDDGLWGVTFVSATNGWACGDAGTILRTTNGGQTWTPQSSGSSASLRDIVFIDAVHGWAVGSPNVGGTEGIILYTENGGITWTSVSSEVNKWFYGVDFVDAHRGWVVGEFGKILSTFNGGQ